jgi:hypothetical protein
MGHDRPIDTQWRHRVWASSEDHNSVDRLIKETTQLRLSRNQPKQLTVAWK